MAFRCLNRGHLAAFLGLTLWASSALGLPEVIVLPEVTPSNSQLELMKELNAEFATLKGEVAYGSRNFDTWSFKTDNLTPFERKQASEKTTVLGWDQCRNTTIKLFEYPQVKYEAKYIGMDHKLALMISVPGFAPKRVEMGVIGWQKSAWVKFSPDCSNILVGVEERGLELIRLSAAASELPKVSKLPFKMGGPEYRYWIDNRTLAEFDFRTLKLLTLDSASEKVIDTAPDEVTLRMIPSRPEEFCWAKYSTFKIQGKIDVRCINRLSGKVSDPIVFKDPREAEGRIRLVKVDAQTIAADIDAKEKRRSVLLTAGSDSVVTLPKGDVLRHSDTRLLLLKKQGLNDDVIASYDLRNQQVSGFWEAQPNGWFQFAQEEPDHLLLTAKNVYGQTAYYSLTANEGLQFRFRFPEYQSPVKIRTMDITDHHGLPRPAYLITSGSKYDIAKNVFVYVHGGGCHLNFAIGQSQIVLKEMLAMAEKGYPILAITYRNDKLPAPYKSDSTPRTQENCGTEEMDDIMSGYKAVKSLYPTANVFLWGMSHGGYLVNMMATQDPRAKLFKGIISQAGVWGHDMGYDFISHAKDHYSPNRAPINFVKQINVPFFMYHGTDDRNASYSLHAEEFIKASGVVPLNGNEHSFRFYKHPQKPISLLVIEHEEHHFEKAKSFDLFIEALTNFVNQNQ